MLQPSYRQVRTKLKTAALFLLLLALVGGAWMLRIELAGLVHRTLLPLYALKHTSLVSLSDIFAHFRRESELIRENRELRLSLTVSKLVALDRNLLYEENLELKERLGRIAVPNTLLAAVVLRPPALPYDTLLVDVGERNGVAVGDKVAASGTTLIGTISEVYARTARVALFSSSGEVHEGYLVGSSVPVTVEGLGGGSMRAFIPYGIPVVEGDAIALPSISSNTVALIELLEFREGDAHQTAYARLPVNPFELAYVDIWRETGTE